MSWISCGFASAVVGPNRKRESVKDQVNTREVIKSLIEIREPEFLFATSYLTRAGIDVLEEPDKARQYLDQMIQLGKPEAEYALARFLCVGVFGEVDRRSAFELYKRASDKGYTPALVSLAHFYISGWAGITVDKDRARELLIEGANRGYGHAAAYLATAYAEGTLGTRDNAKSRKYLVLAAELGDADSQYLLGNLLLDEGGPKEAKEAESWLKLAAESGVAAAHRRLAFLYSSGGLGIAKSASLSNHHRSKADDIEGEFEP